MNTVIAPNRGLIATSGSLAALSVAPASVAPAIADLGRDRVAR